MITKYIKFIKENQSGPSMTLEEFYDKVSAVWSDLDIGSAISTDSWSTSLEDSEMGRSIAGETEKMRKVYLSVEVLTGGASGGNCWGGEAEYFSDVYFEKHHFAECIRLLLEKIGVQISVDVEGLVESSGLCQEDIRNAHYYDAYGNFEEYTSWGISLGDLYDLLVKNGVI